MIAAGKPKKAARLLHEGQHWSIVPDAATYRHLLTLCNVLNRWEGAIQMFQQLRTLPARLTLSDYKIVMEACENNMQWSRVVSLLEDMKSRSVDVDSDTYYIALRACTRAS